MLDPTTGLNLRHNDVRKKPDTNEYVLNGSISIKWKTKIESQPVALTEVRMLAALQGVVWPRGTRSFGGAGLERVNFWSWVVGMQVSRDLKIQQVLHSSHGRTLLLACYTSIKRSFKLLRDVPGEYVPYFALA